MPPDDLGRRIVDSRASFKLGKQPCRRAIVGDRTCGKRPRGSELIEVRLRRTGHCSIPPAANGCLSRQTIAWWRHKAVVTAIKARSLLLSRRVEAGASR